MLPMHFIMLQQLHVQSYENDRNLLYQQRDNALIYIVQNDGYWMVNLEDEKITHCKTSKNL